MKRTRQDFSNLLSELMVVIGNLKNLLQVEEDGISMNHPSFCVFLDTMVTRLSNCQVSLQRDYLKCVFVGRTSNGKSSVINALLRHQIIPMGVGHTTNCFVTLVPKEIDEAYIEHFHQSDLVTPVSVYPMEKLKSLCHALSPTKVDSNDNLKVNYPVTLSPFGPHVQIVDSPGMDLDTMHDGLIDVHCRDADLFVLVTNAESVLMQCERQFFLRVKDTYNTPNILVVNNRWDSSSEENAEDMNKVKIQQLDIFSDFLVRELNICLESQLQNRVFFVSALEEIRNHSNHDSLNSVLGRIERSDDFKRLETTLKENLSPKALKNKISINLKAFQNTFEELNSFINCLFSTIIVQKDYVRRTIHMQSVLLKNLETDIIRIHQKAANYIEILVMKASDNIANDFNTLVCNLDMTVNTVKLDFDPYSLKDYLAFQRLIIENLENSLFQELRTKTMISVNEKLKIGVEKLTKIYTELVLSSPTIATINQCSLVACQPPIHDIYPTFSATMNEKITAFKAQIARIPSVFLSEEECTNHLNNVYNRYSAYCTSNVDDIVAIGSSVVPSSSSQYPEVTLMVPKFSAVILTNYSHTPGFQFSLSPNSMRIFMAHWTSSDCPIRKKLTSSVTRGHLIFLASCGVAIFTCISFKGRFWKHGLSLVMVVYGGVYLMERITWDTKREVRSLKSQFTAHCKRRLQTIVHISAITTARQLGSFLHLDLKGLQIGAELLIRDFHDQVYEVKAMEAKILGMEKRFKKVKAAFFTISQQISAFKKEMERTAITDDDGGAFTWTS